MIPTGPHMLPMRRRRTGHRREAGPYSTIETACSKGPGPRAGRQDMDRPVYLDYNATARIRPEVIDVLTDVLRETGNASSVHAAGRRARKHVEDARESVAALVGARPGQVVFTSGGTEANNQVMRECNPAKTLVSAIEHAAVLESCPGAARLPVDGTGVVDLAAMEAACAGTEPEWIALMLANNETGVIQPVAEAAAIAHRFGARIHCDAVQAAGKIPVDFEALGVDSMAVAAHKLGGPQGVGALIAREPDTAGCLLRGGGQERGLRGGTENVAQIAGFGAAARMAGEQLSSYTALAGMRDGLERRLAEIASGFRVFGTQAPRLPNTSQILMPGVPAETQVIAFDLAGIAVSAGSACSAGRVEAPYVLTAMGVPDDQARCALRVSLGWDSTNADIERFAAVWHDVWQRSGRRETGKRD